MQLLPSAGSESTNVDDPHSEKEKVARLLGFLSREIDRNLNAGRHSGVTIWALLVLLLSVVAYVYQSLNALLSTQESLKTIVIALWVVVSVLMLVPWVQGAALIFKRDQERVYLASNTTEIRAAVQAKQFYVVYALVLALTGLACTYIRSDLRAIWALGIYVGSISITVLLSVTYYRQRRRFQRKVHYSEPDYTLYVASNAKVRLLGGGILLVLGVLGVYGLVVFFKSNWAVLVTWDAAQMLPTVGAVLLGAYLLSVLVEQRTELNLARKQRRIEFDILKGNFTSDEIVTLIAKAFVDQEVNEWIENRVKESAVRMHRFDSDSAVVLDQLSVINRATRPDPKRVFQVFNMASDFRQTGIGNHVTFLEVTLFHCRQLRYATGISEKSRQQKTLLELWSDQSRTEALRLQGELDLQLNALLNSAQSDKSVPNQ